MDTFRFRRDFRHVVWGATLWLNVLRAASAGLVVGTLVLLVVLMVPGPTISERLLGILAPPAYMVIFVLGLPIYFAIGIACGFLAEAGVPYIGVVPLFFSLVYALGDPVLFLLHRKRPDLVPVMSPRLFNLRMVIFVLDPDYVSTGLMTTSS